MRRRSTNSFGAIFIVLIRSATNVAYAKDFSLTEYSNKLLILFPPRRELADGEVSRVRADAGNAAGEWCLNGEGALAPACGKDGRLLPHAVSVVAERFMEWRTFSDRAVHQVACSVVRRCVEIDFLGNQQLGRCIRHGAQNGLTPDDHPRRDAGNGSGRAKDMLQFIALHSVRPRDRSPSARPE